jgi:hypothetical protein
MIYAPGPNANAQQAFVNGLYQTLLGRPADNNGLAYWVGRLNAGLARADIVGAFWNSDENRTREVAAYYQAFLRREPDAPGLTYWAGQLKNGLDETAVILGFLQQAEGQQAPDAVFVQALYSGVLGRTASDGELRGWLSRLSGGESRQQVASAFLFSAEAAGLAVTNIFGAYLQRAPVPTELDYWTGRIASRQMTYAAVAQAILAGTEFYNNGSLTVVA